ncbi:DNA phosphorothioation-dependent restriction protein DptF [Lacticaseibacillus songhuajiangensis]|jgi:DNA phosphorothioation-dependent restriction protein DptF|uniref:DNA phosphorothioation-dependent restriction protein DptF n=1 Tax=Lacticaseibacillus songhuajiangensis TaxID=1296539 RepID=UPI000F79536A|nr:DNA phosphorothioation-dependent restriction protein DptF [Lacticaseibacillus songhuajiangensis]
MISQQDIDSATRLLTDYKHADNNIHGSKLRQAFERLSIKSKEAVVSGDKELDSFHQYLHVVRPIETELEEVFSEKIPSQPQTLTLIVGNVGDGKSHLLAYEKNQRHDDFIKYGIKVHNDATESLDPQKTAIESLQDTLATFNQPNGKSEHLIVAINLGVLINFAKQMREQGEFTELLAFLDETEILRKETATTNIQDRFQLITFRNSPSIKFVNGSAESEFTRSLLEKITSQNDKNPFYSAYLQDKHQENLPEVINYRLLLNRAVQASLESLLIKIQIQYGQMLSARQILNFIHDVVIPLPGNTTYKAYLPSLLFTGSDRSVILKYIAKLDPILNQNKEIDRITSRLFNTLNFTDEAKAIFTEMNLENEFAENERQINGFKGLNEQDEDSELWGQDINYVLRLLFLLKHQSVAFSKPVYTDYVRILGAIDNNDQELIHEFMKNVSQGMLLWNGVTPMQQHIFTDATEQSIAIEVNPRFDREYGLVRQGTNIYFAVYAQNAKPIRMAVDFQTYSLLRKIINGYNLRRADVQSAVDFNQYVQQLVASADSRSAVVRIPNTNHFIRIMDNDYEYTVEEVNR